MSPTLEEQLRTSADHLSLDRPPAGILDRGRQLRRQRRRRQLGALTTAGVATAFGGAVLFSSTESGGLSPAPDGAEVQTVSWTGGATNLTPDQLRVISEACGDSYREKVNATDQAGNPVEVQPLWDLPAGTLPSVAELRDHTALTYFRVGDRAGECVLEQTADGFDVQMTAASNWRPIGPGQHLRLQSISGHGEAVDPGQTEPTVLDNAVLRVSDDVATVTLEGDGDRITGTVTDGLGLFWFEGRGIADDARTHQFVAYDADGKVLQRLAAN